MIKEKLWLQRAKNGSVVLPERSDDSTVRTGPEKTALKVRWEKTIIEVSLKQGYTIVAL